MSDSLGNGEGDPTEAQIRLYERWAEGGVAVSIIGDVQVDPRHREKPGNLVFGTQTDQRAIKCLVRRATIEGAHRIQRRPCSRRARISAQSRGNRRAANVDRGL